MFGTPATCRKRGGVNLTESNGWIKDAPAESRVRTADCVLQHATEAFVLEDHEVRRRRLEQ